MTVRERWIVIRDFPDYLVSNYGSIKKRNTLVYPGIVIDRRGYLRIYVGGNYRLIHRLVVGSFFDMNISGYVVRHVDGDKLNNVLWDLEIITEEVSKPSIKIENLDTGEVYSSLNQAGRALGLINTPTIPLKARKDGSIFRIGGYRCKLV